MDDVRGNPVATRSREALAHIEQALWRMASRFGDLLPDIAAAERGDARNLRLRRARVLPHWDAAARCAPACSPWSPSGWRSATSTLRPRTSAARPVPAKPTRALGRALLDERCAAKPATPLTEHWAGRLGA